MKRYATIVGTGRYLPEIEVSNAALREGVSQANPELADVVDAFQESSGIRSRWYAPRDWATSDIALRAAQKALEAAGIRPEQVDMILLGTDTPDYITPATSTLMASTGASWILKSATVSSSMSPSVLPGP